MGWTPARGGPLAGLPRRPPFSSWAALLDPPPGPGCRCLLGARIHLAWPERQLAPPVAAELLLDAAEEPPVEVPPPAAAPVGAAPERRGDVLEAEHVQMA
eukprot:4640385-Alexandrium_andersonii.AAC.1